MKHPKIVACLNRPGIGGSDKPFESLLRIRRDTVATKIAQAGIQGRPFVAVLRRPMKPLE